LTQFIHKQFPIDWDIKQQSINGKRHYFTPEGSAYPSITTCLSVLSRKSIMEWRKRVGEEEANKISTQAARRGTKVHQMCEDYINNELDEKKFLPTDRETFRTIKPIIESSIDNVYAQEVGLYSDYLEVAGRVDCIAEWEGKISVIDFKTSRKPKKKEWISSYFQQASAYAIMWEERTKIPINQLVILIAVDDNEPQVFIERRDNWAKDLINTIKQYKEEEKKNAIV